MQKSKLRKLHTSQISADLFAVAGLGGPLQPSLININEYLPRNVHQHKMCDVAKGRDKQRGFQAFMRNGCIFVRRKKEDTPIPINTEDVNAFLDTSSSQQLSSASSAITLGTHDNTFLTALPSL